MTCGATAGSCCCVLDPGHEPPHSCDPEICTGRWAGEGDDFTIVRLPDFGPNNPYGTPGELDALYGTLTDLLAEPGSDEP